jgi:AbrB family looped-hinge helix DNA binding protein
MSDVELKTKRSNPHGIKKVRVWGKGQFTIPAEMRERLGISEDTILEVFQIGKAIIATPENIKVKELAGSVQKDMEKNQIDIDALLAELREGSHSYETE